MMIQIGNIRRLSFALIIYSILCTVFSVIVSCSDRENIMLTDDTGTPILFSVSQSKFSRAVSSNAISNFKVYAYDSKGNYYINGAKFNGNGTSNSSETYYWPLSGSLSFYAISPSDDNNNIYSISNGVLSYTVPTDNSKQIDLMVAKAANQTKSTNKGVVNLQFQHVLSQVVFKGYVSVSGLSVEVQSITIHNVNSVMTLGLNGTATAPAAKYANYSIGMDRVKTVTSAIEDKADDLTASDGVLMLVPQTLTGWDGKTTIEDADKSNLSYIEVSYRSKMNGIYIVGSSSSFVTRYVPLSMQLLDGKSYTFNIAFKGQANPTIKIGTGTTTPEESQAKPHIFY